MASNRVQTPHKRPRFDSPYEQRRDSSDQNSDVECSKKTEEIRRLREKVFGFKDVADRQLQKIKEQEDELKEKNVALEESQKKNKGIENYIKEMDKKVAALNKEKEAYKKKSDELQKQFNSESNVNINGLKKQHSEAVKRLHTIINKQKEELSLMKNKMAEKDTEMAVMNDTVDEIERLNNQLLVKTQEVKKLKDKLNKFQDKYKAEIVEVKAELKKSKGDNSSLKHQRKYFQDHNETNKRKYLGVSHSIIKQKELLVNGVKETGKATLDVSEQIINTMIEFLQNQKGVNKKKCIQVIADNIKNLQEKSKEIDAAEKRIVEKRADGRVACGSCISTFATTGDLTHHMTSTHKMNTSDRSKNVVPVLITLE